MLDKGVEGKMPIVLDVRNDYEWDAGHFVGAERPQEEVFAETPVGEQQAEVPEPLKGLDPETPVMMYCTGGIRCDVYSTVLKQQGYKNLYTLEGGVQNYLAKAGGDHWKGSLFVFDGRMAINPALEKEEGSSSSNGMVALQAALPYQPHGESSSSSSGPPASLPAAVACQVCADATATLPHVNCANMDCNELFIACDACKKRFHGCCCEECVSAPRLLRPIKIDGGNYGQWGNYADSEVIRELLSPRQREGRVARRARRREAMKERRDMIMAEKKAMKAAAKAAMAKLEAAMQQQAEQQEVVKTAAALRKEKAAAA